MPPETQILYEHWMPHYRAERMYKCLDGGLENQVSMIGYLWARGTTVESSPHSSGW